MENCSYLCNAVRKNGLQGQQVSLYRMAFIFLIMYDIICYYVQQVVYWTLYFGVAGFVIYIFIGQQIHDAKIMLGKDEKEENKGTKNI